MNKINLYTPEHETIYSCFMIYIQIFFSELANISATQVLLAAYFLILTGLKMVLDVIQSQELGLCCLNGSIYIVKEALILKLYRPIKLRDFSKGIQQ